MTTEIEIDGTFFKFPSEWRVEIFDEWPQYRGLTGTGLVHGCDVVAIDGQRLWLIEMKDYSYPDAEEHPDITAVMLRKAIGTMAVLGALGRSPSQSRAQEFAAASLSASSIVLALHVEPRINRSKRSASGPLMAFQQKVTRAAKKLWIAKAVVSSTLYPDHHAPWTSRRNPDTRDAHQLK